MGCNCWQAKNDLNNRVIFYGGGHNNDGLEVWALTGDPRFKVSVTHMLCFTDTDIYSLYGFE